MKLTLQRIESHLWAAANSPRGSPVDRTDWKPNILPPRFFKRNCAVMEEEHAEMLAQYGEDFADEHRFQVPEGCNWSVVRRAPRNVGNVLVDSVNGIEAENQERLEALTERHEQGVLNSVEFLKHLLEIARDLVSTEKDTPPDEDEDRGKAALTELFQQVKNEKTPVMVERVVADIDEIVRLVRFPGWQTTAAGEREVKKALRRSLLKYQLHQDAELFERAYGYIRQYY